MSKNHDALRNDPRYKRFCRLVIERDARCQQCGSEDDLTADHIVAIANGGDPFDLGNGQCLCRRCNGRKSDRVEVRLEWFNPKWLA